MKKERLDKVLVSRGFVKSRDRAKALIMEGKVLVNGATVTKAGTLIDTNSEIILKGEDIPYVSRGGLKLEGAIRHFRVDVEGKTAMDVGASTGGFTDCLLKHGAKRVYAVDVGYGQLAWSLRNDPRVIPIERTNIRHISDDAITELIDLVTVDVSFISLLKVIPHVLRFLKPGGEILALIKPQFEAGKSEVDKGGVIKDEIKRQRIVSSVVESLKEMGLEVLGVYESPVKGQKGNVEFFAYLKR